MATIGNFDGVHRGHQLLIDEAVSIGLQQRVPAVAITFDPHPVAVFAPDKVPPMLTTIVDRVSLLRQAGAREVFVLSFDRAMASWPPEDFVNKVLLEQLQARHVVVGENFTYGSKAAGTVESLRAAGAQHGFNVSALELGGDTVTWSSTAIRAALSTGDVVRAAQILGRPHYVSGQVQRGDQRGRTLGFPTANLVIDAAIAVPADGVYAGFVTGEDAKRLPAAISVGTNPTFNGAERRVESYVLDHTDLDLYDRTIRVEFVERLRGQETFADAKALVAQMNRDVERTRQVLR